MGLTGTQSIDMADHVTVADGGEKMSEHVVRCLRVTGALCATGRFYQRVIFSGTDVRGNQPLI